MQSTENKLIHIGKPIEFDKESFFDNLKELERIANSETEDIREHIKKIVINYDTEYSYDN